LVEEPSNCWALSAGVTERLPHRHQVRVVLVERVLELTERSSVVERSGSPLSSSGVADLLGEVTHVRVPEERWEWLGGDQVQLIRSTGFSSSTPVSEVRKAISPVRDRSPTCARSRSVPSSRRDFVHVERVQFEHARSLVGDGSTIEASMTHRVERGRLRRGINARIAATELQSASDRLGSASDHHRDEDPPSKHGAEGLLARASEVNSADGDRPCCRRTSHASVDAT